MYLLAANLQDVQSGIIAALRTLLLRLCDPVYKLIIFCFDIFEDFGSIRLFENSDTISGIYNRIGLILGLFMIFRISFSAIEYIINPDNILDKSKGVGNIIKKVIIVIVLLGSTRFLFDFAYEVQEKLIDSQVVPNIILGGTSLSDKDTGGENIAWYTFSTFYQINDEILDDKNVQDCKDMIEDGSSTSRVGAIYQNFVNDHSLDAAEFCLNQESASEYEIPGSDKAKKMNVIKFNGILCLVVGLALLWTIFNYTIQLGVRVIQLAYLELIAPIPIMMYLTPSGDEKLKNWGQQCLTTFVDFFIRLAIMDFIILVSSALIELQDNIYGYFNNEDVSTWSSSYIIIIMIIALMIFAKRIPELIKEVLPSTGGGAASLGFGFGATGETKKVGGFLGGIAGGTIGGATNALVSGIDRAKVAGTLGRSRLGAFGAGVLSGGAIGIKNGAKGGKIFKNLGAGWTARNKADREYEKLLASGGSATGKFISRASSNFGETKGQTYQRQIANLNRMEAFRDKIYESADSSAYIKNLKDAWQNAQQKEGENLETFVNRKQSYGNAYYSAREAFVGAALDDNNKDKTFEYEFNGRTVKVNKEDLGTPDDQRAIDKIVSDRVSANKYADSYSVQVWNEDNKKYEDINKVTDFDSLNTMVESAQKTEKHIKSQPDYGRAVANDNAAGIGDERNFFYDKK